MYVYTGIVCTKVGEEGPSCSEVRSMRLAAMGRRAHPATTAHSVWTESEVLRVFS